MTAGILKSISTWLGIEQPDEVIVFEKVIEFVALVEMRTAHKEADTLSVVGIPGFVAHFFAGGHDPLDIFRSL